MLHMIVSSHSPETCPGVVPEIREKAKASFQKMGEVTKKLGITPQGGWLNGGGHIFFMLLDAPNAHVIEQMGSELGLGDWNTSTIYPVMTMEEAQALLQ